MCAMENNTVIVKIGRRQYPIKGDESLDYLYTVANYVDKVISELTKIRPTLSTEEASVLAALNIADELFKQKRIAGEWENRGAKILAEKSKF